MTEKTPAAGADDFSKLLGEIGDLHKALPAEGETATDDAKIDAAAEDGEDGDDKDDGKGEVTKSFKLKLEDGTEVDALDGTELIKSLTLRVEKTETGFVSAMTQVLDIVKSQAAQIKKLSDSGKGRKAVVSVAEKPAAGAEDLNKSDKDGISPTEFLAKSMTAFTAGKISGHDVRRAETAINQGKPVPAEIIRAVMAQ